MSLSVELTPVIANIPSLSELHVGAPHYAAAAVAVGAFSGYQALKQNRSLDTQAEADYPTPDMAEAVRTTIKREKRRNSTLTGLAALVLSAAALNEADITAKHTELMIDDATVVVDASFNSYVKDIDEDGETTKRIEAVVNGINELDTAGINISYWAAGANSEFMGTTNGSEGQESVVDNFFSYTSEDLSNRAGNDLENAVTNSLASGTQKVLIFSNHIDDETAFALQGQEEPDQNRVSVIQLGEPKATVDFLGQSQPVINDKASAEAAVGSEDVYDGITSVEQLQEVFNGIKMSQFVSEEQRKLDIFKTIRDITGFVLAGGVLTNGVLRRRTKGVK